MAGMQGSFDATNIPPQQGAGAHPAGMFDFTITHTEIKPNKENTGGYFEVELTSPAGRISTRYNLWNPSAQAVEIANKQLSALCHATGIFRIEWTNEGAALRGGVGRMEVGPQKNNVEYMEVKRVFDRNGNEPGRPATAQQQPQQQPAPQPGPAPMTQQAGGGWSNPAGGGNAPSGLGAGAGAPQSWGQAQPQTNAAPAPATPNAGWANPGTTQGTQTPPWGGNR